MAWRGRLGGGEAWLNSILRRRHQFLQWILSNIIHVLAAKKCQTYWQILKISRMCFSPDVLYVLGSVLKEVSPNVWDGFAVCCSQSQSYHIALSGYAPPKVGKLLNSGLIFIFSIEQLQNALAWSSHAASRAIIGWDLYISFFFHHALGTFLKNCLKKNSGVSWQGPNVHIRTSAKFSGQKVSFETMAVLVKADLRHLHLFVAGLALTRWNTQCSYHKKKHLFYNGLYNYDII